MPLGTEVGLGPGHIVLDGDPASPSPKKGHSSPQLSAHVYCVRATGCIKMPLGTEVGLCPGNRQHCVRWGPSSPKRGTAAPTFRCISDVVKRLDGSRIKMPLVMGIGLGNTHIVLDGEPPPLRKFGKGYSSPSPHFSAHFALARSPISVTAELLFTTYSIYFS